jgi:hypothetical protein
VKKNRLTYRLLLLLAASVSCARAAAACRGDCDGDGAVVVAEVITGVEIALRLEGVDRCPSFDGDGNESVTVDELLSGIASSMSECPPPTAAVTPTATQTPTVTPNPPPELVCADVYRSFSGFPIELAIPATDPDGGSLRFVSDSLPPGAELDEASAVFTWTPDAGQTGVWYVPFTTHDEGGASADGQLIFVVSAPGSCRTPRCTPALGCEGDLAPLDSPCCEGGPEETIPEPVAPCPAGRVVHVGKNRVSGFGRIEDCDRLFVRNMAQTGAVVVLNVEAACLDFGHLIKTRIRLETATRLLFDDTSDVLLQRFVDGYGRAIGLAFPVLGPGPFFEFEGAEARLSVTMTDGSGVVVGTEVRPILTFEPVDDLDDPEMPEPPATAAACTVLERTPTPTATTTPL